LIKFGAQADIAGERTTTRRIAPSVTPMSSVDASASFASTTDRPRIRALHRMIELARR
jgi:hypothetical protein